MICDHSVELGAIGSLASPVMISSGTFGVAKPYMELLRGQPVGAVVTKTITLNPKAGNPQPRIYEGPCYLINSIGLENQGVDRFVDFYNDEYGEIGFPVIVSISGNSVDEFVTIARKLNSIDGLLGLELNLSCPNVDGEGLAFGSVPERIGEVVKACGSCSRFPLIAKLSPFQAIDDSFALAAARAQVAFDRDDAVLRLVGCDVFRIPEQGIQDMGKLVCQGSSGHDLSFGILAAVVPVSIKFCR